MLNEPDRGPKRPTMQVPGIYAGDMNLTRQTSVKDCRLSASRRPTIRVKTNVGPCGGFVRESDTIEPPSGAKINMRHANRRFAKAMAKRGR
jgi:hypothetical protein